MEDEGYDIRLHPERDRIYNALDHFAVFFWHLGHALR